MFNGYDQDARLSLAIRIKGDNIGNKADRDGRKPPGFEREEETTTTEL